MENNIKLTKCSSTESPSGVARISQRGSKAKKGVGGVPPPTVGDLFI